MKRKVNVFGKDHYFLGSDASGTNYYLQAASFDCGWYWGFGYVETFTNNTHPERSRDIESHQHFNGLIFNRKNNGFDNFKVLFINNPFSDREIWQLCELMKTFYTLREYADTLHRGGSHYTTNPIKDIIKNDSEYNRINKEVIPALCKEVYKIMGGSENE